MVRAVTAQCDAPLVMNPPRIRYNQRYYSAFAQVLKRNPHFLTLSVINTHPCAFLGNLGVKCGFSLTSGLKALVGVMAVRA